MPTPTTLDLDLSAEDWPAACAAAHAHELRSLPLAVALDGVIEISFEAEPLR